MTSQYEVSSFIREEFPELEPTIYPAHTDVSVYVSLNKLTNYTKLAVHQHDLGGARKCFQLAARLYENGDKTVRDLIENIFVYSFETMFSEAKTENLVLKNMIPQNLYFVYLRQVMTSGC
ncbi:DUF7674 family protein [Flavitalea sp.]|nr:hypothetical protein [Flavitalea sp.]